MTFSADPGATLTASVHLIPEVNFGLKALDGLVSTSLFLDFDSSLSLQGNVSSTTNSQPCLSGSADVEIEVGAKASFFHIFSPSTGIPPLFHGGFQLFDVRAICTLFFSNIYHFFYTMTEMLYVMECREIGGVQRVSMRESVCALRIDILLYDRGHLPDSCH